MTTIPLEKTRSILIADSDGDFIKDVLADPKCKLIDPIVAQLGDAAQLALAEPSHRLLAAVINPRIEKPSGLSVIRACRVHRPTLPIIVIYEGEPPYNTNETKQLGIYKLMKKPVSYSELVAEIAPNLISFEMDGPAVKDASKGVLVDAEFSSDENDFIAIRAEDYLVGSVSFFDLYVKLSPGKFIKILQKNEAFEPARLTSYLKKGVKCFYLEKAAHVKYLGYCDRISEAILQKQNISIEYKASATFSHGEETMKFLQAQGLNSASIQFATTFCRNVDKFVRQVGMKKNSEIASFIDDFSKYEHGVACSVVAGLLAQGLDFQGERAIQLVGTASLFHDVGLTRLPPECHEDFELTMSPEHLKLYHTHPAIGAQILGEIKGVDPAVTQAIGQHHERRTRKGFPANLGAGAINRLAEMVGICDDFIRLMKRPRKNPKSTIFTEMDTDVFQGYSVDVTTAFRTVFFPR